MARTPEEHAAIDRANELLRSLRNATAAANNPELAYYPEHPTDKVLRELGNREMDCETNYFEHLQAHRVVLGNHPDFRADYGFLDELDAERIELADWQTWTGDPEQPIRRSDRHLDR
ncbi:hypothetical protein ACFVMC_26680 [Nocardia sp. NPDC127579]|uniref:hypothetical protein n=1 Tax=Nocardia sp. NPDC127579 TaxID=3345402 RepID=UPI003628ADDB